MTIFQITLSMTVMILLLLLFEKVIGKKFSAKCRYILWAVIMLRLAVPLNIPIYTVEVPEFMADEPAPSDHPSDTTFSVPTAAPETTDTVLSMPTAIPENDTRIPETAAPSPLPAESTPAEVEISLELPAPEEWLEIMGKLLDSVWLKAFWLTGAVLFAAYKLTAHGIYTAGLKRNRRLADEETYKIYRGLAEKYRIKHPPALYINDAVASPMLYGFFKPCILLPSCCMTADPNAAVVVLSHELTHFRRGDLWIKLIGLLGTSLHWFNPFVHLAFRRCTQAMELSCDEAVLKGFGEEVRRSYGNVMLDIVRRCRNNGEALTTHFNPRKNAVMERFLNILDTKKKRRGVVIIALVLLLCVAGCTVSLDRSEGDNPPAETEDTAEDTSEAAKDISGETEETKPPLSENEQLTKELNNARAELLRQIDVLTDEYNAHSEQIAELFEKLSALHSQDYKWKNEERLVQEQIASLQAELEEMQEQDAAAENELSLLRAQAEDIQSWLNDYAAQEDAIKSEMSVHQQQLDVLDNKIKELRAQEAEIKTQFIELLVKIEEENASEAEDDTASKRNKAYRLWLDGMISMEALIASNDCIREDMAVKVNEIIQAFREGKNPMELLPNPPTLTKPTYTSDFNEVPYVTADQITTLYFDTGGKSPENGNCTHKFTIPIDGKTYANEYMDLYWSIGIFGESTTMYINHIEIYMIQDRLSEGAASLPIDQKIGFHYLTRFPNSGTWLCAGNSEDGDLLLYYTPNNGDRFYRIESEISDKTYDTAAVVAALHSGGSTEMQIIAELEKDGEVEYVSFNNYSYTDNPYEFTYAGAMAYEELVNILAMSPAFSYAGNFDFPNKNVPEGMKVADDTEELDALGLDGDDGRLRYIRALLDKDVETLEVLCLGAETGMYADYADLHITKWLVQVDVYPNTATPRVTLSFRAYRSSIDAFPEGSWNTFIVQDGMYGVSLYSTVQDVYEGAAGELVRLLNNVYFQSIPGSDDPEDRWCLTEFICTKLTEKHGKLFHTSAEIKAYAEKVFGIADFTPAQTHLSYGESHIGTVREDLDPSVYNIDEMEAGDVYASVPHGGISHAFRITELEQTEDSAVILVQFYADISETVRSHLYQYQMKKVDGDWTYTGCTLIQESQYEPFCVGT